MRIFSSRCILQRRKKLISNNPGLDFIVLGTQTNIQMLTRYPNWFCDGTFDSAPVGYQLYTIHALLNQTATIPLVFCTSKSKTEVVYKEILLTLKENYSMLNPQQ